MAGGMNAGDREIKQARADAVRLTDLLELSDLIGADLD